MAPVAHAPGPPGLLKRLTRRFTGTFFKRTLDGKEKDFHMESIEAYQVEWKDVNDLLHRFFPKQANFSYKLVSMVRPGTCKTM
ncbi:hypothetical protein PG997_008610 [Apiospora hydei]|uniref:Uncharacterized protein n=1 Tax=Apiospora hydei TaxID=1337664 RepID=A0ABR1WBC6_9PEZI